MIDSRKLEDCIEQIQQRYKLLKMEYELGHVGNKLFITCTYRSIESQKKAFAVGRDANGNIIDKNKIITNCDGIIKKSRHNYYKAQALDFGIISFGKISWREQDFREVGELAIKYGLVWGIKLSKNSIDLPHLQWRVLI